MKASASLRGKNSGNAEPTAGLRERVIECAESAIERADSWLGRFALQYDALMPGEDASYAEECSRYLLDGSCPCCRERPVRQHNLANWRPSDTSLREFVQAAIVGPCRRICANSLRTGMVHHVLLAKQGLRILKVAFKICDRCGARYQRDKCSNCASAYDPTRTELRAEPWIVAERFYTPVRLWACGQAQRRHYFAQMNCRERIEGSGGPDADVSSSNHRYRVVHGREHDQCPLCGEHGIRVRHSQRGTTVYVLGSQVGGRERPAFTWSSSGQLEAALSHGLRDSLHYMRRSAKRRITVEFRGDLAAAAYHILTDREALVTADELEHMKECIRCALAERNIHAKEDAPGLLGLLASYREQVDELRCVLNGVYDEQ